MSATTEHDLCPSTDRVAALIDGSADASILREVLDHAGRCGHCEDLVAEISATVATPLRSAANQAASVPAQVGRYQLLKLRGTGGAALVYRAHDPQLEREVAIKLLRDTAPSRRDALLAEARAQARIEHPNVLAVFDAGECDGDVWVATPLVEGGTLRDWVTLRSPDLRARMDAVREAAAGLEAIHAAGLVHRDITPNNLLVTTNGRVLVADLGLATPLLDDAPLAGTPGYLAPELIRGGSPSPRSDQFALCVVAFELLTGVRPQADQERANARALRRSGVPRSNARTIVRGLRAEPARRLDSTSALRRGLERPRSRSVAVSLALTGLALALPAVFLAARDPDPCAANEPVIVTADIDRLPAPTQLVAREYADALQSAARTACETPGVERDVALACLRQRATILDATIEGLEGAEEALLQAEAVSSLDFPAGCLARDASAPLPPAELVDDLARARVELARARVLAHRGRDQEALSLLDRIAGEQATRSYAPLHADIELVRAKIADRAGRKEDARVALNTAADLAARSGYTAARLDAVSQLLVFPVRDEVDRGRHEAYLREIEGLIDSVQDPRATADSARTLLEAALAVDDHAAAVRWARRALADRRVYLAEDDPRIAAAKGELGTALAMHGDIEAAWAIQQEALHTLQNAQGDHRTEILFAKAALSQTARARGDNARAVSLLEQVRVGLASAPDATPALRIHADVELCVARASIGLHEAARKACDEAFETAEEIHAEPIELAWVLMASATAYLGAADPKRALAELRRARALVPERPDDDPSEVKFVALWARAQAGLAE